MTAHLSTDLKPSLTAKQNDCVVYFSPMHTMKVPVHKIQSCSMFCYRVCMLQLSYMNKVSMCLLHILFLTMMET